MFIVFHVFSLAFVTKVLFLFFFLFFFWVVVIYNIGLEGLSVEALSFGYGILFFFWRPVYYFILFPTEKLFLMKKCHCKTASYAMHVISVLDELAGSGDVF